MIVDIREMARRLEQAEQRIQDLEAEQAKIPVRQAGGGGQQQFGWIAYHGD